MSKIVLHGRKVVGGCVEGEALVTKEMVTGWGGIDTETGVITDVHHELHGQCFKDKILVFPGAKGSSGWSGFFQRAALNGVGPKAMVYNITNTKVALGAVLVHAPAVTDLDQDPTEVISTGDWVKIDADNGTIEVNKK